VEWEEGAVELLSEAQPWEPNGRPRRAGVSSFGISGTNVHLILEEAPAPDPASPADPDARDLAEKIPRAFPVVLSAKTRPALAAQAGRVLERLQADPELRPIDLAYSLATTRSAFERRAVALCHSRAQLGETLAALAREEPSHDAVVGRAHMGAKLAYLFTGQGSQRARMGAGLYEAEPVFAAALDEATAELDRSLDRPLDELLFAEPGSQEAELLNLTTYAQPAIFAIEVALHRLLDSRGLTPDLLVGHSIGELAAAQLAGVLSLADAADLVVARGALMGALPDGGAMVAIEASEDEARSSISGAEAELAIAAINGPRSVVVSGAAEPVAEVEARWDGEGRKTRRLPVSHAFHSPLIEPMLEEFERVARGLSYSEPQIPIVSGVDGEILGAERATDPTYWVEQARRPVRFADALRRLHAQGTAVLLELGPDAVLSAMASECGEVLGRPFTAIPTLRRDRSEPEAIDSAVAHAHAAGAQLDWEAFFAAAGAKRVPLPTYPFQRERYRLNGAVGTMDASSIGQRDPEHPLLGAKLEAPRGGGVVLTGRLSLSSHPWLADHAVAGTVLLPGTAFVELALRAAEETEMGGVEELTLQVPLILSENGAVEIQVSVAEADDRDRRAIAVHSRAQSAESPDEWVENAAGVLAAQQPLESATFEVWPPPGAEPLETEFLYDRLAEAGFDYGPAFQGVRSAWRVGEDVYGEVALPDEQAELAGRFALHPALLDSALHALAFSLTKAGAAGSSQLPFSWSGVAVERTGSKELRVKISSADGKGVSLELADGSGVPLGRIGSLALRPLDPDQLEKVRSSASGLLAIEWRQVELSRTEAPRPELVELSAETAKDPLAAALAASGDALEQVQAWLLAGAEGRLAVVTHGAVRACEADSPDPALAAAWGLLRSAQAEHPDRIVLIDSDGVEASEAVLNKALTAEEEPQLALRDGAVLAPRAVRAEVVPPAGLEAAGFEPGRTVLITGGTGALGSSVARHLAAGGVRHLLLVSRGGLEAPGARELDEELKRLGAESSIVSCDISKRVELEALLASIPQDSPLGAVVHTAGVLADATIEGQSPETIESVFAPKAGAAWYLHDLTAKLDLSSFVLYSSAAGALGSPGQGNYAAANAFLDALAQRRCAEGLPATSIAWGLWQGSRGMMAGLRESDLARARRAGLVALSEERGLELFMEALVSPDPAPLAIEFDRGALRNLAAAGALPPALRGLVRVPRRSRTDGTALAKRLASAPEAERETLVLELVRTEVAGVLGHGSPQRVDPERAFQEMGFDSLAAVELRNRLGLVTGEQLAATVVFDYPNASSLARHLLAELAGGEGVPAELELTQLGQALAGLGATDPSRPRIAARLRALAADLESDASAGTGNLDSERLRSASDEELLDLIDAQVGSGSAREPEVSESEGGGGHG